MEWMWYMLGAVVVYGLIRAVRVSYGGFLDGHRAANGGRLPGITYTRFTTGEQVVIDGETGEERPYDG